jgi:hypothetical protein
MFITDAVLHGMPPHIAQLVARGRLSRGSHQWAPRVRHPTACAAPAEEYRVPTEQERDEFLGHFQHRKLALGTCGRSYATPCIHFPGRFRRVAC